MFEQEGVYEYVTLTELENDLIRIDDDVLSLEYPNFLPNYFLVKQKKKLNLNIISKIIKHGDQSWLCSIAKSLVNIQNWFGKIPKIHMHGSCSKVIIKLRKKSKNLIDF